MEVILVVINKEIQVYWANTALHRQKTCLCVSITVSLWIKNVLTKHTRIQTAGIPAHAKKWSGGVYWSTGWWSWTGRPVNIAILRGREGL